MTDVFLSLLNVSITATWVAVAVFILRLCLKKAPKWITCLLWGVVGLRLILPFSLESGLSLIPSTQTLPQDILYSQAPTIQSGISSVDKVINPVFSQTFAPQGLVSVNPLQLTMDILAVVWLVGMAVMLLYGIFTTAWLYRSVRTAVPVAGNVYCGDDIHTPFILGVFMPRIFLPSGLDPEQTRAVIAHEEAHLRRRDHLWKPIGFVLLTLYWYNPFLWVAYILLCRDIELACDESVIKAMDVAEKKQYSQALIACANGYRTVMTCPLAFGEVGVKVRIKAVLHYKKPSFWIIGTAAVATAVLIVCFLTDPKPCEHVYQSEITLEATCTKEGVQTFTCADCGHSYTSPLEILSHSYGQAITSKNATCTQQGEVQYICADCGDVKAEPVTELPHNFTAETVTKEPNCTETGIKTGWCDDCAQSYTMETLPTNDVHDMVTTVIQAATCAQAGAGKSTCSRCGLTEEITYEKLDHSYTKKMEIPATCARGGQKQMVCDHCGKEQWLDIPINPDAHWWIYNGIAGYYECVYCPERKDD